MRSSENPHPTRRGRGAAHNPANRFESITLEQDDSWDPADTPSPSTLFFKDDSQTILARNNSPDIPFTTSINPYRGCEHGCIYCYARPTHEYLGFSSGLDFESRIMVKENAPHLLRKALSSKRWRPQVIALSGVTDCYQPVERQLKLTRRCLEQLAAFRNPVGIVTKNHLVTRDIDYLKELAQFQACAVFLSITTLDSKLAALMEPRTSQPEMRLRAVTQLAEAGIPVGIMVAPVIPALNDHEIPLIIKAAGEAGAQYASYVAIRLPHSVNPLFQDWLTRHYPDRKDKVLNQIRSLRDGQLNETNFGTRMRGQGRLGDQIETMFKIACRKAGVATKGPPLSTAGFRIPASASDNPQGTFDF